MTDTALTLRAFNDLFPDEDAARAYLRGEAVPCACAGWLVATYGGMPLGWGKATDGLLKNHLPKGLRRAR